MAAIMAVLELPPRFSRSSHVKTESRYGMKSAFFDFLFFDACEVEFLCVRYIALRIGLDKVKVKVIEDWVRPRFFHV